MTHIRFKINPEGQVTIKPPGFRDRISFKFLDPIKSGIKFIYIDGGAIEPKEQPNKTRKASDDKGSSGND